MTEPLEVLRQQIIDFESRGSPVPPEEVSQIFHLQPADRTYSHYQKVQRFLQKCSLFITIKNAKVISDSSIVELIKSMRYSSFENKGAKIFNYGTTNAPVGSSSIDDMEAFIVVKGLVSIKAPRLVQEFSVQEIIDSYEDIIWEKTENGSGIKSQVDQIIENNLSPPDRKYDVWMFQQIRQLGPTEIFGDVVLIQPKPRTTTAVCMDGHTELLSVSYDNYTRVIDKAIKRDLQVRTGILQQFRIFRHMTQHQLEKLLFFTKPIEVEYGRALYRFGDETKGIYLIQKGAFEISMPSTVAMATHQTANKFVSDVGVKLKILKKTQVQQDRSLQTIKIAILEKGEVLGIQEYPPSAENSEPVSRLHTATCIQNNSTVLFLPHNHFVDFVLAEPTFEADVNFENILHRKIGILRKRQNQRTVWNAKNSKQPSHDIEATFDQEEQKGPKLRSTADYIKEKINIEYYGLIINGLQEREMVTIQHSTKSQLKRHEEKKEEIINFFQDDMMMGLRSPRPVQENVRKSIKMQSIAFPSVFNSLMQTSNTSQTIKVTSREIAPYNAKNAKENFSDLMDSRQMNHLDHLKQVQVQDDSLYEQDTNSDIKSQPQIPIKSSIMEQKVVAQSLDPDQTNQNEQQKKGLAQNNQHTSSFQHTSNRNQISQEPQKAKLDSIPSEIKATSEVASPLETKVNANYSVMGKQQNEIPKLTSVSQMETKSATKAHLVHSIHLPSIKGAEQSEIWNENDTNAHAAGSRVKPQQIMNKSFQNRFNIDPAPQKATFNLRSPIFKDTNNFAIRHSEMQSSQNGSQLSKDTLTNKALPLRFGSALPEISDAERNNFSPVPNLEHQGEVTPQTINYPVQMFAPTLIVLQNHNTIPVDNQSVDRNQFAPTKVITQRRKQRKRNQSQEKVENYESRQPNKNAQTSTRKYQQSSTRSVAKDNFRQSKILLKTSIQTENNPSDLIMESQESVMSVKEIPALIQLDTTRITHQEVVTSNGSQILTQGQTVDENFSGNQSATNQLSAAASAAAQELIQNFLQNPNQPTSAQEFLQVQAKYNLSPDEAFQILIQQLNLLKMFAKVPTAATVVKMSHNSYQTHLLSKKTEIKNMRKDLQQRFTNPISKLKEQLSQSNNIKQILKPSPMQVGQVLMPISQDSQDVPSPV